MALATAAAMGSPVTLLSAAGAGGYAGAGWFKEVVALAASEFPGVSVRAILDCADAPGHVLAALREGIKVVRFTGTPDLRQRLVEIAEALGAEIVGGEMPALEVRASADPAAAIRAWLEGAAHG